MARQGDPHRPTLTAGELTPIPVARAGGLPAGVRAADAHIQTATAAIDAGGINPVGGGVVLGVEGAAGMDASALAGVDRGAEQGCR